MERLTDRTDYVLGVYSDMEERLMEIKDILGDEYDLERLRELAKRDTALVCKERTINRGMDVTGEYDIDYDLVCPSCGAAVGDAEYNELNGPFCQQCGQRLALPNAEAEAALRREQDG